MKAIAGSDIKVGMTVILKPGGEPFTVARIEPGNRADNLFYLYRAGEKLPEIAWPNRWYALVES